MKKLNTKKSHFEQINLALDYIHCNFGSSFTAEDLAAISGYSIFHFHRIFKEITQENVNDYVRNARLEKASNLLLYHQHKSIETIAHDSGFASAAGFRAAFKKKFFHTPKAWRKGGYEKNASEISGYEVSMIKVENNIEIQDPSIVNNEAIHMVYMMTCGYKDDMSEIWSHMNEWCESMGVFKAPHRYIGLFHNHPSFEPYNIARYLACIETNEAVYRSGRVGKCLINEGKFARFSFTCTHAQLYKMMHLAYTKWLPNSNYEVRNFPAYVEYKNPDKLLDKGIMEVDFYMPIQFII